MGENASQVGSLGEVAVAGLGVAGTLVLTLTRPLAAWPVPAEGTLCSEAAGRWKWRCQRQGLSLNRQDRPKVCTEPG